MANLSQQKRERMLEFLKQLKSEHTDDASLMALNEIENALISKKYGLVWEQHEEQVDVMMRDNVPVFTEVADREIKGDPDSDQYNFLLEGDNLHSLKLLEKTHRGRIDVIYIDPPYNTGDKNFMYDDSYVDVTDGYRHSKWLSFMDERLKRAKSLLSDKGVVFISIDDNEMAQLKLLSDEIFGSTNFVGMILWKKKTNGNNMGWLPPVHDYILCYSKNIEKIYDIGFSVSEEEILKRYSNPDDDPRGPWTTSDLSANHVGPNFVIKNPVTGQEFLPPDGRYWVFNEAEVIKRIEDGRIIFGKSGNARPVQRVFAKDRTITKRKAESWWDNSGLNADATKELTDIFGKAKVFKHPKPASLIKDIIRISCDKDNSVVLDFFAGSGTTAQAVLELNKEDGGNRRFILCTNNENNVCEKVTYQRIKTIITGLRADDSVYSEGIPANLKYYTTDYIAKISDQDSYSVSDELLKHIKEMIQLENGINVDGKNYIIILSDDDADELEKQPELIRKCKGIYISNDVFLTSSQEQLFAGVVMKQIPDYYFEDELREVHEIW